MQTAGRANDQPQTHHKPYLTISIILLAAVWLVGEPVIDHFFPNFGSAISHTLSDAAD